MLFYHGVKETPSGSIYRVGLALLDLAEPRRCLRRSNEWIFGPVKPYERVGDVPSVVFTCGAVVGPDGDTVRVYYGAADTSICLATASLKELLAWLERHISPTCEVPGGQIFT